MDKICVKKTHLYFASLVLVIISIFSFMSNINSVRTIEGSAKENKPAIEGTITLNTKNVISEIGVGVEKLVN